METLTMDNSGSRDLSEFLQKGKNAMKRGDLKESFFWFKSGMDKALERQDDNRAKEFAQFLFILL